MSSPKVFCICVGSELLSHGINTNVHSLNEALLSAGFSVSAEITVPDKKEDIASALRWAIQEAEIIVFSGGLGPTFDDITREAVAETLGKKVFFSPEIWKRISDYFLHRSIPIPESNRKQAFLIEGGEEIINLVGTAPGIFLEEGSRLLFLLPGPPVEFRPMVEKFLLPKVLNRYSDANMAIEMARYPISGLPESIVDEKSRPLRSSFEEKGVEWTILAKPHFVELWASIPSCNLAWKDEISLSLRDLFGLAFLGEGKNSLSQALGVLLVERKLTLALAESCTGGLVGHLITEIPGSSRYFTSSCVTYSNSAKRRILKVSRSLLRKHGAVSREVALAMAKGAKKVGKADIGVAITGIAGPSGGSPDKPVGLVWIAVVMKGRDPVVREYSLGRDRAIITRRAAAAAMDLVRRTLLEDTGRLI